MAFLLSCAKKIVVYLLSNLFDEDHALKPERLNFDGDSLLLLDLHLSCNVRKITSEIVITV